MKINNLRFGKFTRANLTNADLRGANLEGAVLGEARLSGARLTVGEAEHGAYYISDARLRGAQLWLLKLPDAFLHGAQLEFVYAHEAQLPGADMRRANLLGAWTRVMDLRGADLRDARLQGVDSFAVDLRGADLRRAQLQGAELSFARLQGADLRDAQLQGANLTGAKLDAADLRGASLWNARFKDASLRLADLRGIKMDALSEESRRELIEEGKRLQEQLDWHISFWVGSVEDRLRAAFKEGQGSISTDASIHDDAAYGRGGSLADWGEPFELDDYRPEVAAYLSELACDDVYVARGILCERRTPGERAPEYVPHTSYVPGMMDPRTADVFSAMRNYDCLGLRQLPPDALESLRTWKAPAD